MCNKDLEEAILQSENEVETIEKEIENIEEEANYAFVMAQASHDSSSRLFNKEKEVWQEATELVRIRNRKEVLLHIAGLCRHLLLNMLIVRFKEPRSDIMVCVESLIYISKQQRRTTTDDGGIPALSKVVQQLKYHYGKRFVSRAAKDLNKAVDRSILSKLLDTVISQKQVEEVFLELGRNHQPSSMDGNSTYSSPLYMDPESIDCDQIKSKSHPLSNHLQHHHDQPSNISPISPTSARSVGDEWEKLPTAFGATQLSFDIYTAGEGDDPNKLQDDEKEASISLLAPTLPIYFFRPNVNLEIGFDARTRNPLYVLERINVATSTTTTTTRHSPSSRMARPQFFEQKEDLPEMYRSKLHHYFRSGYDRGHMAPVADFTNEGERRDTFTMCNVSPQLHSMNCSTWKKLEHWCRQVARNEFNDSYASNTTYAVTGPLWLPQTDRSTLGEQQFRYSFPALGSEATSLVHVPTHFFKVLAVLSHDSIIRKFACVVVPNGATTITNGDACTTSLRPFIVKWTDLEAMSGLQFFPSLTSETNWRARADGLAADAMNCAYPRGEDAVLQLSSESLVDLQHLRLP
eukprot:scaffold667_cov117-Cylindrotheca_fusiformis.AAC.10